MASLEKAFFVSHNPSKTHLVPYVFAGVLDSLSSVVSVGSRRKSVWGGRVDV